ncbi:hypothetical protein MTR67_042015 [Solanum verrucosum]|uniref:Isopenicillin N synthase-like Fe(2+) 2OG dioxygenase domain-containing protein n=1 Tax=Solanum verrucosum TaxID=315347 RepID=A0AAF0UMP6_SOLVR|nr:hypothetical protein MTR67_042015 [Solanum verrucosum]
MLLKVSLDNEVLEEFLWVVNTYKEEHDNTVVSLRLYSNLEDKIITNGEYKSAQHRAVTNAGRSRLSVATFHDPSKTRQISPAFHPPRYRPVIYGDYVSSWYTKGPEGKRNLDALLL